MDPPPGRVGRTRHLSIAEEESENYLDNFYNQREKRRVSFVQRGAMNQVEFDEKFDYSKPHQENEVKRQAKKFAGRFCIPFSSCFAFKLFIFDLIPILKWLPEYNWKSDLTKDFIGGITVGVMQIPQGIAYALLARQPAINGLYASLFPPLIYMFFGTSRHSSLGTFAVVSLMTGMSVEKLTKPPEEDAAWNSTDITDYPTPTEVSCAIAFTMGLIFLITGILRLQILTTYLSDQLIAGFTVGAAIHVLVSQLKTIFGIRGLKRYSGVGYLFRQLYDLVLAIGQVNYVSLGISATSIIILICGKFLNPIFMRKIKHNIPIPFELLVVILSTIFVYVTGVNTTNAVQVVNEIPSGIPEVSLPRFSLIPQVFADAGGIAFVSAAMWLSFSKTLAKSEEYQLDSGQEFFALAVSSMGSSFIPTVPISCSLSRTMVAYNAGVTTQLSILFSSTLVFLVVFFLGSLLETLPMAALSAIICVALWGMLEKFKTLPELYRNSKIDLAIWIFTFVATIILDVTLGLIVSVGFALLTTIFREQFPKWHILAMVKGTYDFRDCERYGQAVYFKGICVFRFDSPLLYYNVERFKSSAHKAYLDWQKSHEFYVLSEERNTIWQSRIDEIDEDNLTPTTMNTQAPDIISRHFVIDCSAFTVIDLMGVNALKEVFSDMRKRRILVYFANAKAPVREMFARCNFYKKVPKENFYPTMRDATSIARQRQMELGFKDTEYVPDKDNIVDILSSHPY
ncbi:hypothetical protein GCK72_018127 [Caenorhabditis remanei]|uniref:STAS domain-containing protein n=1 Tax=Caenorhabditis remanei TaxID=31234 RepID=A0A6A5GA69_CAERE|nr:hypothetical protein GCK72_018127 [Caenorhabditis remanei]KAF1751573.1 hypothetical protein GCK72_018127 [Caenorhabditis remanei]